LGFSIFLDSLGFVTCALALLILRSRGFNSQLVTGPLTRIISALCVAFMLAYGVVATAVVLDNWRAALTGVVLLLLFVGLYFMFAKPTRHAASH
jgi:uncharacterized metal-binding protein